MGMTLEKKDVLHELVYSVRDRRRNSAVELQSSDNLPRISSSIEISGDIHSSPSDPTNR